MANLKSSEKKAVNNIIVSGHTKFERNVTIQAVELHEYKYSINGTDGTYNRLLVVYGDNDDKSIFGNQKGLVLNPREDTAYPLLVNVKPGAKGKLTFEVDYSVLDETTTTDKETGEVSKSPYQKEVDVKVVDFTPTEEKKTRQSGKTE